MREIIYISVEQIKPNLSGLFKTQGIPPGTKLPERIKTLFDSALEIFLKLAAPIGIMSEISISEFGKKIYPGIGINEPDTPLEHIIPKATQLALFAFTLGPEISLEIEEQVKANGLALGYMLDAVASYSADKASEVASKIFLEHLFKEKEEEIVDYTRVLLYSPGYCGWHISGQQKLFDYLKPEEIGIRLNESFLMLPLKSISGVLVAGKGEIHRFKNNYPFCAKCQNPTCRERMKIVDK